MTTLDDSRSNRIRGLASLVSRAIEGEKRWGSVIVSRNQRAGWTRYRVMVFPPGTSLHERRIMQANRCWPMAAALVLSFVTLALLPEFPTLLVVSAVTAIYVAGYWSLIKLTADLHRKSAILNCAFVEEAGRTVSIGDGVLVLRTLKIFENLDARRDSAAVDEPEHEARWAAVYDALIHVNSSYQPPRGSRRTFT